MIKTSLRGVAAAAALLLASVAPAQATPLTWHLHNVSFTDGASASGSLIYDPATNTGSVLGVSVTAGPQLTAFNYNSGNSGLFGNGFGPHAFSIMELNGKRYFNFSFVDALSNAGGTFALNTAASFDCMNCAPFRLVAGGTLTTAEVPEPGGAALMLGALGAAALVARRRRA